MTNTKCPVCGKGQLSAVTGTHSTEYLGRDGAPHSLQVADVTWYECDACGEAVLDDAALTKIDGARCQARGLLSPSKIKRLRTSLRKTQTEMSRLLGVGKKTYCRWESGSYTQSLASDRYLRLLIAEPANVVLLERMEDEESLETARSPSVELTTFTQLAGTESLYEIAETFTELLNSGELHAVDEVLV